MELRPGETAKLILLRDILHVNDELTHVEQHEETSFAPSFVHPFIALLFPSDDVTVCLLTLWMALSCRASTKGLDHMLWLFVDNRRRIEVARVDRHSSES